MPIDSMTEAIETRKRAVLLVCSMLITFVLLRVSLYFSPNADFNVGPYNIHHLFTGLLIATAGGVPLALFSGTSRFLDLARVAFGVGLAMALDEWVYLIATDGTNESYQLPVSLWGALVILGLTLSYAVALVVCHRGSSR